MSTVNFEEWVAANQHLLKPPVGNKQLFPAGADFITMVVGGPNQRTDYHVDPYEEFFYQVKGNIHVNVMTDDGPGRVDIHEGEMWVLPRNLPHSPQRPEAGSIGLVIERVREEGTLEKFRWYCARVRRRGPRGRGAGPRHRHRPAAAVQAPSTRASRPAPARNCGAVHPGKG